MKNGLFFIIALVLSFVVNSGILSNNYSCWLIFIWLTSLLFLVLSLTNFKRPKVKVSKKSLVILGFLLLPLAVRFVNLDLFRIHADEFISAHISANLDLKNNNFFSSTPPGWTSQFPLPYFVFQKLFFYAFGESFLTVKLSIFPYVFIVSLMLYLIVKKVFNRKLALIAAFLYAFFPISVYFEVFGTHVISSTAVFLLFFYFCLQSFYHPESRLFAVLSGIFCGFCYLFYYISYQALLILLLFFILQIFKEKRFCVVKNLLISLLAFFITLGPFLSYALKYNNYFLQRFYDVGLLSGNWSPARERISVGESRLTIVYENLVNSTTSLYKDGIGGAGGYNFGHLAFFEKYTFFLFLLGCLILFSKVKKKPELLMVVVITLVAFLSGVVLMIPPPAYHRFALAIPFLVLIVTLPFERISQTKLLNKYMGALIIVLLLIFYALLNQIHLNRAFFKDIVDGREDLEDVKVLRYIEEHYPQKKVYIAAFPTFALGRVYYFYNSQKETITNYHKELMESFNPNEDYLYIILFPDEFSSKFTALDPNGRLIEDVSRKYDLFVN